MAVVERVAGEGGTPKQGAALGVKVNPGNAGRMQELGCDEYMARHSEYVDGLLSPVMSARLVMHARACGACARYDRIVRKGAALVRELPDIEPSEEFEMRLQHRIFHVEDARALQSRGTGAAAALGVAAAIALLAWSPLLVNSSADLYDAAPVAFEQTVEPAFVTFGTVPMFSESAWYPSMPIAPSHQPSALLAMFPGPYSPLVVTPPAHRQVRAVSAEYAPVD